MKTTALMLSLVMMSMSSVALAAESSSSDNSVSASQDDASRRPPRKDRRVKKADRRRPVNAYRPVRPRGYRTRVIVNRPVVTTGPAVYYTESYPAARQYNRRSSSRAGVGLGVRVSGVQVDGEKLNLDTVENATMGGIGLQVRGALDKNWSLEGSVDFLYADAGTMDQTTVPLMLSAIYTFIPEGVFRPYGLLGAGIHLTALEYDVGYRYDMVEFAAQAGFGIDLRLAESFGLQFDLRFLGIFKNLDDEQDIYSDCTYSMGYNSPFCSGVSTEDKFNLGTQFMVGANWYF